jgi:rSAM/selenodomain-associated transferase 2/rSAM/selenodomain-associated transferase 1
LNNLKNLKNLNYSTNLGASPGLSIILPVLNEVASLAAQIAALQPLRAAGAELVVVDGGSTDGSLGVINPAQVDQLLITPRGRALQMNAGARASRGEVLLFLHADTRLPPAADAAIQSVMQRGASWGRFDVSIAHPHPLLRIVERMMCWRSQLTGIATGDQAIFVRKTVFEAVGGYPEIPLMEDIALSKRLRQIKAPACLRECVTTAGRRWAQHGVGRTILLMWRLRAAYFLGADPRQLAIRYGYAPAPAVPTRPLDSERPPLAVFSKAPLAGQAKTRLASALGAAGAARLQRRLTLRTLSVAQQAGLGPVTLWCAPDHRQRFFRALQRSRQIDLRSQTGDDLGQRMASAFNAHAGPLLLIGCDCPALTPAHLADAASRLREGNDAVFITAEDGGYVLVGLRCPQPALFTGVDWGTAQVMAQTRQRLIECGLRWVELGPLWDVDRPADLPRLLQLDPALYGACA